MAVTAIVALVLVLIIGGIWFASHGVDAAHYFKLGDADYFEHKDYDKAISDYTDAIRLDPTYVAAYFERGNAYLDKKNYDKAISDYNEVISLDPKYVTAYYQRSRIYLDKKDYERAISDYTEMIRLRPDNGNFYFERGNAYRKLGKEAQAQADFEKAKQLGYTGPQ